VAKKRVKTQPQRTCVACREVRAKRDLVRIVRTPENAFVIDERGKVAGRGAYLCPVRSCWLRAIEKKAISRALKAPLPSDVVDQLRAYAESLPESLEIASKPLEADA